MRHSMIRAIFRLETESSLTMLPQENNQPHLLLLLPGESNVHHASSAMKTIAFGSMINGNQKWERLGDPYQTTKKI
jgi:hypothetical protein